MVRKAFYSFHYHQDNWRASKVRNMGVIEGNRIATDNEWEDVAKGGDSAIQSWIDNQMRGKSVAIILIGSKTAGRRWIEYEIVKAWNDGKGVLGVYIHNLADRYGKRSSKGKNPFRSISVDEKNMASIVKAYDPPYLISKYVYNYIQTNLADWIEDAIAIRKSYGQ